MPRKYLNLKDVQRTDYLAYLDVFDAFDGIPKTGRRGSSYADYLDLMVNYFVGFFARARPLFNLNLLNLGVRKSFEEVCRGPEARESNLGPDTLFCPACKKLFANEAVFRGHLGGRKHLKASRVPPVAGATDKETRTRSSSTNSREVSFKEYLIARYSEILDDVREATKSHVEHKLSRSLEERAQDVEDREADRDRVEEPQEPEEDYGRIYNPLKLPLDWDGKPIPYWLWKLHGLGVEYPCEICGNHVYKGRRAFDAHFYEWRHAHGMKALGIPNTRHFFQIIGIKEAEALWTKIKEETRLAPERAELVEEFEDAEGNVYDRKTYELLAKQGLL